VSTVSKGADAASIAAMLAGYPDLVAQIPKPQGRGPAPKQSQRPPRATQQPMPKPKSQQAKQAQQPQEQSVEKQHPAAPQSKPAAPPAATAQVKHADPEAVLAPVRKKGGDAATMLTQAVLAGRGRPSQKLRLLKYLRGLPQKARKLEKRAFLLRGPPGLGKSAWALREMLTHVLLEDTSEDFVARLAHICALGDFFTSFSLDDNESYDFDAQGLEMARAKNEARFQLAIEAGVRPLYVDSSNLRLWELTGYAKRAKSAGFEVTIVSPEDLVPGWSPSNIDASVPQELREAMLGAFQEMPADGLSAVLQAKRGRSDAGLGDGVSLPAEAEEGPRKAAKTS